MRDDLQAIVAKSRLAIEQSGACRRISSDQPSGKQRAADRGGRRHPVSVQPAAEPAAAQPRSAGHKLAQLSQAPICAASLAALPDELELLWELETHDNHRDGRDRRRAVMNWWKRSLRDLKSGRAGTTDDRVAGSGRFPASTPRSRCPTRRSSSAMRGPSAPDRATDSL
jgi:hypothetical protein